MDLQDLLPRLVELISTRFGFYHVGIFLLDSVSEWAVLQAASSEGGKHMLARGYRVQVSSSAVVSQAVEHGKPQIVLDTTVDEERFANPDLPETCSMIALPLRVRGEIIGAMEVHSVEFAAFIGEDVSVLQTLTDQVAVAISNVRLFQQAQQALDAERRAYGELSRQAWAGLFAARPDLGFLRDKGGVTPLAEAAHQPQAAEGAPGGAALAAPIQVRGQTIGVIDATKRASAGRWSDDEATLLKVLAEQLGVALEGARLYTDAQRRAAHERLVGEVTARVRETLDVDIMLKTAVEEVRQALQLPEVTIRLVPPSAVEREAKNA
jgi:GAF domain-containing protein